MDVSANPASARADRTPPSRALRRFMDAGATVVIVIASFATVYALSRWCGAQTSPAIVAAIVAIGLSRRPGPAQPLQLLAAPFIAASVAVLGAGVGMLLRTNFSVGALLFTGGMFLSIWLRNFGDWAKAAGVLVALPLIGMLVVPVQADAPGGPVVDLALFIAAGIVPFAYATLRQRLGRLFGQPLAVAARDETEHGERRPQRGLPVATRMAIQMAVALLAAFVAGRILFPTHWSWTVLTAFIVCSGARGRGDAAYKGLLRLAGAVGGTLVAAAVIHFWHPVGMLEAAAIFGILFLGLWLRDYSYAYWASCMTLVLALLASPDNSVTIGLLGTRLEAILAGALCGVAAAWFVFPIRTEAVIRRRIADALRALDDLVAQMHPDAAGHAAHITFLQARMEELDRAAMPVHLHRRIFVFASGPEHPSRWIELVHRSRDEAVALAKNEACSDRQRTAIRRAIGVARRAVANHGKPDAPPNGVSVSVSLTELHEKLAGATV